MAVDGKMIVGVALVALIAWGFYTDGKFASLGVKPSAEDQAQQVQTVKVEGACASDPATLTAVLQKKYSASTSMASENVTIVVNGVEKSTKKNGQTESVNSKNNVELYFGLESGTYYTSYAKGVIPCAGSIETSDNRIFSPADAYQLYQMDAATTAVMSLINKADYTVNPTTALTLGVGSSKSVEITITPTYEDGLGTPCGNVLSCQYNTTAYATSVAEALRLSDDGVELPVATNPSSTLWAALSVQHGKKSWQLPAFDGKKITEKKYDLAIKAHDTNNPSAGGGDINCTIFDTDFFRTNTGGYACGIEDSDDNSDVGLTSASGIVFTKGILVA